ncbi:unnamed protein product [Closterium sp. Naga37s-1]|nr:unnamed protein product [Closterium sp. Naga37s-1]
MMALLTRLRASPHSSPCYLLFFFLHLNPCGSLSRGRKKRQKYLPRYQHLLPDETYLWPCMAISNPCWPFLPALSSPSSLSPPSQPCEEAAAQVPATLPAPAARCLSLFALVPPFSLLFHSLNSLVVSSIFSSYFLSSPITHHPPNLLSFSRLSADPFVPRAASMHSSSSPNSSPFSLSLPPILSPSSFSLCCSFSIFSSICSAGLPSPGSMSTSPFTPTAAAMHRTSSAHSSLFSSLPPIPSPSSSYLCCSAGLSSPGSMSASPFAPTAAAMHSTSSAHSSLFSSLPPIPSSSSFLCCSAGFPSPGSISAAPNAPSVAARRSESSTCTS